ncbi:S10 family peptidase [Rhizobium oryzicola]|uniref:Carboxypeptidase n=1 Tax=Rhizobium oryzicola TaxID=1232668 RepID=A0ABT8SZG5_9HYPH|nr:carboxypeptidase [Rhizobium oryzicola]MDO1583283.1 carboxypeptidase [Rhizobium oryzicola]
MSRLIAIALSTLVASGFPAVSQERPSPHRGPERAQAAEASPGKGEGIFSLLPADSTSEQVLNIPQGPLPYTATAGTIELRGQDGAVNAKIFYTAYRAKDRPANRPVTFAFNGGPGAASAYLHLGLVGPKILSFTGDNADGTRPALQDNPESWLAFTDLVLIDPVGTGWSRAVNDDMAAKFWGVRQDADALAKVISLYVQKNNLIAAPKYLLGESYGGFRAAKVALSLKSSQGLLVSGIIMLSPLIDGRFIFARGQDPLAAALQFPSLAAGALERKNAFDPAEVAKAEQFAMTEYLVSLAGPSPTGTAADAFFAKLSNWTGLSLETVRRTRGFVGDLYSKEAAGEGKIVSPYDAGSGETDPYPEASYAQNDDPILDGYTRAYGGAFVDYALNTLKFRTEMTYSLLNEDINRRWEWNGGRGGDSRVTASVTTDLRDLMSTIPSMKLMIAHGYSDTLTPYGAARYVLDHLPPALAENRAELKVYRGGHMFYTRDDSRRAMFEDAQTFYQSGSK